LKAGLRAHGTAPNSALSIRLRDCKKFADRSKGALVIVRSRRDLQSFLTTRAARTLSPDFLALKARALEGRLENLDELYAAASA